jgi:hypothetical protein
MGATGRQLGPGSSSGMNVYGTSTPLLAASETPGLDDDGLDPF